MRFRMMAVITASLLTTVLAQAQAPPPVPVAAKAVGAHKRPGAKKAGAVKARKAKGLGLTAAQKANNKTIRQQRRLSAQPVAEKIKANRQALDAAVKTGDSAKIQELSKTQGELRGEAMTIRSQSRAQIYAGLTNEQKQRFDQRQARMQQRLEKRETRKL